MLPPSILKNHLAQLLPILKGIAVEQVPPRTPFNLRVTGCAAGNAFAWENVPAADGYEVQMSETGDFSFAPTVFAGNAAACADVHCRRNETLVSNSQLRIDAPELDRPEWMVRAGHLHLGERRDVVRPSYPHPRMAIREPARGDRPARDGGGEGVRGWCGSAL
jgi:hypothetical protein